MLYVVNELNIVYALIAKGHSRMLFSITHIHEWETIQMAGADPGGGGAGPPLSENLGIDFYSGFRIFFHVYTFINCL